MLIGLGGNLSFGAPSEVRLPEKPSEQNLSAVQPVLLIFKENLLQALPEPPEEFHLGIFSQFCKKEIASAEEAESGTTVFHFRRDLRTEISQKLFPTHYFL